MARPPIAAETLSPTTKIVLKAQSVGITPEQFFQLCNDNPDLSLELSARKEIMIMPPAGAEGDSRNFSITTQLGNWIQRHKTGIGFGPSAGFTLPNGAVRSPDAAWIRQERWQALSKKQRERFSPICPDFVVELRSPYNTLTELKDKMAEYIENGALLGWLIDPFQRKVYVYRPGKSEECLDNPDSVSGGRVLPGFKLELAEIWPEES